MSEEEIQENYVQRVNVRNAPKTLSDGKVVVECCCGQTIAKTSAPGEALGLILYLRPDPKDTPPYIDMMCHSGHCPQCGQPHRFYCEDVFSLTGTDMYQIAKEKGWDIGRPQLSNYAFEHFKHFDLDVQDNILGRSIKTREQLREAELRRQPFYTWANALVKWGKVPLSKRDRKKV